MRSDPTSNRDLKRLFYASGGLLDWLLILTGALLAMLAATRGVENIWS